tara:strand:+ start:69 stop:287 length:219 start_codon:yes stop_codon:yes gene_type:complete
MKEKLFTIIAYNLEIPLDDVDLKLSKYNCDSWDSIALLSIVSDVEQEFNIELKPDQIENISSVDDIYSLIKL